MTEVESNGAEAVASTSGAQGDVIQVEEVDNSANDVHVVETVGVSGEPVPAEPAIDGEELLVAGYELFKKYIDKPEQQMEERFNKLGKILDHIKVLDEKKKANMKGKIDVDYMQSRGFIACLKTAMEMVSQEGIPEFKRLQYFQDFFSEVKNDYNRKKSHIKYIDDKKAKWSDLTRAERQKVKKGDDQNRKKIKELHKELLKCGKILDHLRHKDMSLEELEGDDTAYVKTERYERRTQAIHKKIAELEHRKPNVERIITRKFTASQIHSGFEDIDEAVSLAVTKLFRDSTREKRKKGVPTFCSPSFPFIKKLVSSSESAKGFDGPELHRTSALVFKAVMDEIRKRRDLESDDLLDGYLTDEEDVDPYKPPEDEELKTKFEEGDKLKRTEIDVLKEFSAKQGEDGEEVEISSIAVDEEDEDEDESISDEDSEADYDVQNVEGVEDDFLLELDDDKENSAHENVAESTTPEHVPISNGESSAKPKEEKDDDDDDIQELDMSDGGSICSLASASSALKRPPTNDASVVTKKAKLDNAGPSGNDSAATLDAKKVDCIDLCSSDED